MNSDEERALLERHGWRYDQVGRKWIAPDGFEVGIDDLMAAAAVLGTSMEQRLREVAREHARR